MPDIEHRGEWVSYCSHIDEGDPESCDCAPDLAEVVAARVLPVLTVVLGAGFAGTLAYRFGLLVRVPRWRSC